MLECPNSPGYPSAGPSRGRTSLGLAEDTSHGITSLVDRTDPRGYSKPNSGQGLAKGGYRHPRGSRVTKVVPAGGP